PCQLLLGTRGILSKEGLYGGDIHPVASEPTEEDRNGNRFPGIQTFSRSEAEAAEAMQHGA
ncbi:MAG TPA: hypothetical protein VGW37_05260, partial [Terriglobia bacterium]|nr:hypothetical protein [Terriglobia bacterium]